MDEVKTFVGLRIVKSADSVVLQENGSRGRTSTFVGCCLRKRLTVYSSRSKGDRQALKRSDSSHPDYFVGPDLLFMM